jgi:hypothetical protein
MKNWGKMNSKFLSLLIALPLVGPASAQEMGSTSFYQVAELFLTTHRKITPRLRSRLAYVQGILRV